MLYAVLRWVAGVALRWFYRDVEVLGLERVPPDGALLVASNHPNALIDALVIAVVLPRRVKLTAKATLFDHAALRPLLDAVGVVPLRRAADEQARGDVLAVAAAGAERGTADEPPAVDPRRNAGAFDAIVDALAREGAVLIFPEGISHSGPALAPLRTGLARIALQGLESGRVPKVALLPVGLTFERKWDPRSAVLVTIAEPIVLEASPEASADASATLPNAKELTDRVDAELRAVTLNFESAEAAEQVLEVSRPLVSLFEGVRPLDALDAPTSRMARIARRLDDARRIAHELPDDVRARVRRFLERLAAFRADTERLGLPINDVEISTSARDGAWFTLRELAILLVAGPPALWGRINHWAPLRLARWYARRAGRNPEDPAMITVVSGLFLVLAFYAAQTALVVWLAGWGWGALYLVSLPGSASCDFWYTDRLRRAAQRARAYLRFRRDPALHVGLARESEALRAEADALAVRLGLGQGGGAPVAARSSPPTGTSGASVGAA